MKIMMNLKHLVKSLTIPTNVKDAVFMTYFDRNRKTSEKKLLSKKYKQLKKRSVEEVMNGQLKKTFIYPHLKLMK